MSAPSFPLSSDPDPTPYPLDYLSERGEGASLALTLRNEALTWQDLRQGVAALAGWLQAHVPNKGDRVATWAGKGWLTCLMPLAAARAGLVHVPINPVLKRGQVAHILADSGAALLIANKGRIASLEAGDAACPVWDEEEVREQTGTAKAVAEPSCHPVDDLTAILYTSGSTGLPKGVMLTHANLWLGAVSVAHYLRLQPDDITLAVLPLSFDYGQNQLLSTWYAGGSVVPLDYLTPRDVVKACARHGITTLAAVPPLWVQLAGLEWPAEAHASLRRLTNSGGALTPDLIEAMRGAIPNADIYPMYGLTEAFRSTYLPPDRVADHPTSIGNAIPFAEVLIVDTDGQLAQTGELVHCGPLVAKGYWQDEDRTAERFRPAPGASRYGGMAVWSGDTVRRDAEGLLYFVGRKDGMIKSAGNRISPHEIEAAAIASGHVAEAAAYGRPDDRLGQSIHLVVRGDGNDDALQRHLRRELPNFMQPASVRWVEAMPLNANGKLDRAALTKGEI